MGELSRMFMLGYTHCWEERWTKKEVSKPLNCVCLQAAHGAVVVEWPFPSWLLPHVRNQAGKATIQLSLPEFITHARLDVFWRASI